jgi:phage-related minor tail protein
MGISLEKNAQAYGQKAKEVALQELENRLLEIKDSWIGKIFDKERNSLMIKQAYIKYQQEERQINQQVAEAQKQANQRNIDDLNRLLSLRSQIAQTGLSTLDARIEYKRLVDGELAAAEMATNSLELRTELQRTILELETSQALSNSQLTEREKQLLNDIYDRKIFLLKAEHAIKWRISMTDEARLRTEEKIAKLNRERSIEDIVQTRDQELSGLRARLDLPFNEDKLAEVNLQLEQASRLYQTLTPLQRELKDMQVKREDRAGVVSKKELEMLDADIESVKLKISLQSQYLEAISETEKALLRQQQIYSRYQPLASTIAGAFTSSFGQIATGASTAQQALAAFLQGTADAFLDMASRIIAKWIEMTILNSIMELFPGNPAAAIGPIAKTDWGGGGGGLFGNLGANDWEGAPGIGTGLTGPANPLKFANGGMFTNSIVSSPTLFKFADGAAMKTGVMGEAGAEAVMPLTRGPGGRLGVDASGAGGGDITVNVSVDATGSRVQGDDAQSAELGRLIGAAVHQEMLKQKRPGGLLAS